MKYVVIGRDCKYFNGYKMILKCDDKIIREKIFNGYNLKDFINVFNNVQNDWFNECNVSSKKDFWDVKMRISN